LIVEAEFEGVTGVVVERQEIEVVEGAAMQNPALAVDGGVDESVGFTAVFGLHVKSGIADFDIGVVAKNHR